MPLRSYYAYTRSSSPAWDQRTLLSPAYIYNQIMGPDEGCDGGAKTLNAMRLLAEQGIASMADFPYDSHSCRRQPTPAIR